MAILSLAGWDKPGGSYDGDYEVGKRYGKTGWWTATAYEPRSCPESHPRNPKSCSGVHPEMSIRVGRVASTVNLGSSNV